MTDEIGTGPLLRAIQSPADLRRLPPERLPEVSAELRQFLIDAVSIYGGHFGANLGVVELTVALHYALHTPEDLLVWDVGHQAYGHKILTGRRESFLTNRVFGGLSGFPSRQESAYDAFGVGHSSTSVSAALGMALADQLQGRQRAHVAVIGDGAMTAGMAYEALNHASVSHTNLLIILNDNDISIDPSVGGFGHSLQGTSCNLFKALGLPYHGPVDGHDVLALVREINVHKEAPGPKVLHVKTIKGKGYAQAEKDQVLWHAPGRFDKLTGIIHQKRSEEPQPPKYQDVFGLTLLELAEQNPAIMGITPAMPSGSSMKYMMDAMPRRALDVGIAEQHAVTLSAGLATQGMRVYCNIYSTFMQRAYDQVIHDVALQRLPVVFCLDRAGLVGEDGPTHHGAFDIAYMRCIPEMIVSAPMNESELRHLMYTAQLPELDRPMVIRYPRGQGVLTAWRAPFEKIEIGTGRCIAEGDTVAILTFGHPGNYAVDARRVLLQEGFAPAIYDMRFAKPLDEILLHKIAATFETIITVEDGTVAGGFGSAVLEFLNQQGYRNKVKILGIPDQFVTHGRPEALHERCGYDAAAIMAAVKDAFHQMAS